MTKNRLLNISITICKLAKLIYIFSFILITFVFIHFQIDRDYYHTFDSRINTQTTETPSPFSLNRKTLNKWGGNNSKNNNEVYTVENISTSSIYKTYLKYTLILILLFLCAKEFQNIIQSVKNFNTFRKNNVLSFRRLGKYLIIVYVLSSYSIIHFKDASISEFNFTFTPLIFILCSYILAEIFKEGNVLMEENNLTV